MIKKFTAAVVLGAIVGAVAYKIKKEVDDKKMLEKELEMLSGNEECECCKEECTCEQECECEEECTCSCEKEETFVDEVSEVIEEGKEIVSEVVEEVKEVVEEVKEAVEEKIEEAKEVVEESAQKKTAFLDESLEEKQITNDYKQELDDNSDKIIYQLSSENDELQKERPIQHTIDFKSLDDLETYKEIVIEKGYVATKGENQYQLYVYHIAPVNKSELLVNVYYLANLAVKNNATYQGWQSRKVM